MKILSDIAYADYGVVLAHLDASQWLQVTEEEWDPNRIFTRSLDDFADVCGRYRDDLQKKAIRFARLASASKGTDDQIPKQCAGFLYNPATFVTFGNADGLAVTAVDDFDILAELSAQPDLPVKQTCIAFCPTLKTLGIERGGASWFCEIEDVLNGRRAEHQQGTCPHPFIESHPIVSVGYFRLNGMAVLGPGLLLQQAMYRAIADRIGKVRASLTADIEADKKAGVRPLGGIIREKDLESFACVLLDPQGWADVAVLTLGTNPSLSALVLEAIKSITLGDLYDAETPYTPKIEEIVASFGIHQAVGDIADLLTKQSGKSANASGSKGKMLLRDSHVFCSLFSILGMTPSAFLVEKQAEANLRYRGIVAPHIHLNTTPGHGDLIKEAESKWKIATDAKPSDPQVKAALAYDHAWVMFGADDARSCSGGIAGSSGFRCRSLFQVVQTTKQLRGCSDPEMFRLGFEWSIRDLSTDICVPIPASEHVAALRDMPLGKSHVYMAPLLRRIAQRLFLDPNVKDAPDGHLNILNLRRAIQKLRIPSPVSIAIAYLYIDYYRALCDPYVFDHVVDLYDTFSAFYGLIVNDYPELFDKQLEAGRKEGVPDEIISISFLRSWEVRDLIGMVEVLQDALRNRSAAGFREVRRWHSAVDFKTGGMNKLVSAVDAPLKCAVGLVKRGMDRPPDYPVGVASRLSLNPRAESWRFMLGPRRKDFLAELNLNAWHMIRPDRLRVQFHEAAHLLWELTCEEFTDRDGCHSLCDMREWGETNGEAGANGRGDQIRKERFAEIFAEMFVFRFVFGGEQKPFLRNYVALYSLDPISVCRSSSDTLCRLTEVLVRAFLAADAFEKLGGGEVVLRHPYSANKEYSLKDSDLAAIFVRFHESISDAGPLCYDFGRLYQNKSGSDYVATQFKRILCDDFLVVKQIAERVHLMVEAVGQDQVLPDGERPGIAPLAEDVRDLGDQIRDGYDTGHPVVRVLYGDRRTATSEVRARAVERYGYLDPFVLIAWLMRLHVADLYSDAAMNPSSMSHLPRDPKTGLFSVDVPISSGSINRQIIDRIFNGTVSGDLDLRREQMRKRIVLIKTFWDVSANLRARRFRDMLDVTWGIELKKDRTPVVVPPR